MKRVMWGATILFTRQFPIYQQISRRSFRWKRWQKTWAWVNMFYPDSFPRHFIETLINILTMQGWTMHAIVWKIRVILLQIFVWIVDLKVRERLTEYLKKDIKHHQVIIEVLVWKRCCHKRFCWSKYLLWFYSAMYLISCVDDII